MRNNQFTKSESELLNSIIQTTNLIDSLYEKLYRLEVLGKQDDDEYKKTLDYLEVVLDSENYQYNNENLTVALANSFCDYLLLKMFPDFLDVIDKGNESVVLQDYGNKVNKRIFGVLCRKVLSDSDYIESEILTKQSNFMGKFGIQDANKAALNSLWRIQQIDNAFDLDLKSAFVFFLQEYIDSEQHSAYKDKLIKAKYNMAFIDKRIGDDQIKTSFVVPNQLYLSSKSIADSLGMNVESYKALSDWYGMHAVESHIDELIEISDIDYRDPTNAVTSILRQCFIRSSFLLVRDFLINERWSAFRQNIGTSNYAQKHPANKISEGVIAEAFRKTPDDRKKVSVVSLASDSKILEK